MRSARRLAAVHAWAGLGLIISGVTIVIAVTFSCARAVCAQTGTLAAVLVAIGVLMVVGGVVTGIGGVLRTRKSTYLVVIAIEVGLAAGFLFLLVTNPPII